MVYKISNTPKSVHLIADHFLMKVDTTVGDTISNLKLQKLCYFAQVASLALSDRKMFDDEIQAWAHGPVVKTLYDRFKKYSWQSIDPLDLRRSKLNEFDETDLNLLDQVWDKLSHHSAKVLENMSHIEGGPWYQQYKPEKTGGRCNNIISTESIQQFYSSNQKPDWLEQIAESHHQS